MFGASTVCTCFEVAATAGTSAGCLLRLNVLIEQRLVEGALRSLESFTDAATERELRQRKLESDP